MWNFGSLQRSKNSPYGKTAFRIVKNSAKSLIYMNHFICLM